jgi:hypothetical protein
VNIEQTTPLLLSVVQLGAETAVVATFAKADQVVPLYIDHARPPLILRAAQSTCPEVSSAQLGAEKRDAATVVGVLQAVPLKIETCRPPVVEVAAQITEPSPLLVQLGSETTEEVRIFHPDHVVPLNSFTMSAALPVRTAHTTWSLDTAAHDGLPIPVEEPVDTMGPQLACALGIKPRQADHNNRYCRNRVI